MNFVPTPKITTTSFRPFTNLSLFFLFRLADQCLLTNDMHDYVFQAQGKITIPGVDDGEECSLTDVSSPHPFANCLDYLPHPNRNAPLLVDDVMHRMLRR
jgi:hypothetical protein